MSESTKGNLAAALAAFQAEMPTVPKSHTAKVPTKSGGSYSYTYADLADVTEAAMPLLAKHGLSFVAKPRVGERFELVGKLLHVSGESEEGALPLGGNTPQEIGSSLTYMRRYLLGCLTGLVTDNDDDGKLASQAKARPQQRPAPQRQAPPPPSAPVGPNGSPYLTTSGALAKRMFAAMGSAGITDREGRLAYVSDVVGRPVESSSQMTDADAEAVLAALKADGVEG